jgi:hypothetical protein
VVLEIPKSLAACFARKICILRSSVLCELQRVMSLLAGLFEQGKKKGDAKKSRPPIVFSVIPGGFNSARQGFVGQAGYII